MDSAEQGDLLGARCAEGTVQSTYSPQKQDPAIDIDSNLGQHEFQVSSPSRALAQAHRNGRVRPANRSPIVLSREEEGTKTEGWSEAQSLYGSGNDAKTCWRWVSRK